MLRVNRVIGECQVTVESNCEDTKEDIIRCSWLLNAPVVCGACGSSNISLNGRSAKDFSFAEWCCKDCYAKATMGEYKSPKGALFVKNNKESWSVWKKEE